MCILQASQAPGWMQAIKAGEQPTPESEEYGVGSFVYRARRSALGLQMACVVHAAGCLVLHLYYQPFRYQCMLTGAL